VQAAHRTLIQDGRERAGAREITVTTIGDAASRSVTPALLVLLAAVGLALVIACANVMHLLLARQSGRARELALRKALGAGAARLTVEALAEAGVLACAGGILGVLLAAVTVRLLVWLDALVLPRLDAIRVDGTVLMFALFLSLTAALAAGLLPALRASREDAIAVLNATARDIGGVRGRRVPSALLYHRRARRLDSRCGTCRRLVAC
jgi:ABC-type antimicrobial peptide transport system permease subunit